MGQAVLERAQHPGLILLAVAALLQSACTTPPATPDARSEERRELFAAWIAGPAEFRAEAARIQGDPELARLWAEDLVLVMIASYRGDGVAALGEQHGRFERARGSLLELGGVAVEPLVELVLVGDDVGAKLATDLLVEGRERGAASMLASALSGSPSRSRLRGVTALAQLSYAGAEDEGAVIERLISALLQDPAWTCRAQAAVSLVARADAAGAIPRVCGALSRGLGDPDTEVQSACCRGLAELGDAVAVPALINHLERLVRSGAGLKHLRTAQSALATLTGSPGERSPVEWRALMARGQDSKGG